MSVVLRTAGTSAGSLSTYMAVQVSGQLNAEYYACALTNVYTFGPTFRAENSHTVRRQAVFRLLEQVSGRHAHHCSLSCGIT